MKLTLLCHGATRAMRDGAFPAAADALDDGALRKLAGVTAPAGGAVASPVRAARETAAALGLDAAEVAALRDVDHGAWQGRGFADIHGEAPDAFAHWLASPWEAAPGGETFAAVCARVGAWLATASGVLPLLAVVPPTIARAVLVEAIGIPPAAVMRIDIAPLTTVTLSHHRGWRLQALGGSLARA